MAIVSLFFGLQLREGVTPESFQTFVEGRVPDLRKDNLLNEGARFSLLRDTASDKEYVLHVAFPENEFERVTRAAWPFVVRAILELLTQVRDEYAFLTSAVSANEKTPEHLVDEWNARFGRFSKISL